MAIGHILILGMIDIDILAHDYCEASIYITIIEFTVFALKKVSNCRPVGRIQKVERPCHLMSSVYLEFKEEEHFYCR